MIKIHELNDPRSCLNRAADYEMIFVLLARDPAAPATLRFWIEERVRIGKNLITDPEIQSALGCAVTMESSSRVYRPNLEYQI
jgi:hypothetical protein